MPIRRQMFLLFTGVTAGTVLFSLLLNNLFLERYYLRNKTRVMHEAYEMLNAAAASGAIGDPDFSGQMEAFAERNDLSLIVLDADSEIRFATSFDADFLGQRLWERLLGTTEAFAQEGKKYMIERVRDLPEGAGHMESFGFLENGHVFLMRVPITGIRESVRISNRFMTFAAIAGVILSALLSHFLAQRITRPVTELTNVSGRMKDLDFEARYRGGAGNELDRLGANINELSETLEHTITELKQANAELQQDIAKKEEIDEKRREFLSNVSHELKTPLALIQGYAEGLRDEVNEDAESRRYYSEVIVDEAAKMNRLVRQITTLNQLETGADQVTMERFNLVEMIRNYLKSADILTKQKQAEIRMAEVDPVYVWADEFKTEEVLRNYLSNALNHLDGERIIEIKLTVRQGVVRVTVFNSGTPIPEESLPHIWDRFYKVDKARSRAYGGSGIGLSIVKAIQESMHRGYGVQNFDNGVAFWFELETA